MDSGIIAMSALFGALLGSFGNVLIYRVPAGLSIVTPGSACPHCKTSIKPWDNIPVLSWFFLRGKCRSCKAPISVRYPAVEAGTAAVFALTAARADRAQDLIVLLPLVFVAVVLAVIDLDTKRLPNALTIPLLGVLPLLGAAAVVAGADAGSYMRALTVAVASFVAFLAIALIVPQGFGLGDVKLAPSLGFAMGFLSRGGARAFVGFLLAFLVGSLVGIGMLVAGKAGRKTAIPFGPWLVVGSLLAIWWGGALVELWLPSGLSISLAGF